MKMQIILLFNYFYGLRRKKKKFLEPEKFLVHFRNRSLVFCRESLPLITREEIFRGAPLWALGGGDSLTLIESSQALFPHFSVGLVN